MRMHRPQRVAVGDVAGHEGRDLDHHVGRRAETHQILQRGLAGHVERHAAAVGRPHLGHRFEQARAASGVVSGGSEKRSAAPP